MKKPTTIRNENDVRQYLHVTAQELGYHVTHFESSLTSDGVPDLLLSRNNEDIWIEVKVWSRGIHMRAAQRKWHRDRANSCGESFVVCWIDSKLYISYGSSAHRYLIKDPRWRLGDAYSIHESADLIRRIGAM